MSKYGNDKFYTKDQVVTRILEIVYPDEYDLVIEPSAGNGSFSKRIANIIALDIEPEADGIIEKDYLRYFPDIPYKDKILVIGNPPFGRNGSKALAFIKHSCEFADTIAFILPKSFKKQSFYDKIPLNFWLEYEEDIPDNSFTFNGNNVDIPCVFQVYKRRNDIRTKEVVIQPDFFQFTKKEFADLAVRRVGFYAGKCYTDILDKSEQSHYFIKVDNPEKFRDTINSLEWEHNNTVGPRSISKMEFIKKISKIFS